MTDIKNINDIKILLDTFYAKVLKDEVIGYIFTDIAKLNVEKHMPILYAFWDSVIFGTANYKGNPMLTHIELNKKEALTDAHFDRWQMLYFETVDELFVGQKANLAKERVKAMRFLMQLKIENSNEFNFIQ
jgi:hemoglobin